jgi:hypothetical protein
VTDQDRPQRLEADTLARTARRVRPHSHAARVLRAYLTGRALIDHDAYRLAGFPTGRTSHQRCSDLRDLGLIERTPQRGLTPTGHSAWKSTITAAGVRCLARLDALT